MTSKLRVAVQVFKSYGFAGIAYKVLKRTSIRPGQEWLKHTLIRRHSPYSLDPAKAIRCPHCGGRLEKAAEGMLCHECEDVFV